MEKSSKAVKPTANRKRKPLTMVQKYEYLDRVSALALYTGAIISGRTSDTTYLTMVLNVAAKKKREVLETTVAISSDIIKNKITSKTLEEKGKALFKIVCDGLCLVNGYKSAVITTLYGDKYSTSTKETKLYTALTKKWERV